MYKNINPILETIQPSAIRSIGAAARQVQGCLDLTIGEPDFNTPEAIKKEAIAAILRNETHYPPFNGREDLLAAISSFEKEKHDLDYAPTEIIVTTGATQAIFTALYTILEPGDEVIVPTPAFLLYESAIKLCRAQTVSMDISGDYFQITLANLRKHCNSRTKAIILTSPNNPTGTMYHQESLEAVRKIVAETGIYVICDEVYRDLVYVNQAQFFSNYGKGSDLKENIIVTQSFSKPWAMTGWRVGYLLSSARMHAQLSKTHQFMTTSATNFSQSACIKALQTPTTEMREIYRRRRDFVLRELRDMGFIVPDPEGAFYVFPQISHLTSESSYDFCLRLIKEGKVALVPGSAFGGEGFVRLSYCYSDEQLQQAMLNLKSFKLSKK